MSENVLSVSIADRSRLHRLFLDESANARRRAETRRQHLHFKPIYAALGPTTKVACDYTKWPEVTRAEPVAANAGRGPCRRVGAVAGDSRAPSAGLARFGPTRPAASLTRRVCA
jgi:hypothetical protein